MPILLIVGGLALLGGTIAAGSAFGNSFGTQAGQGTANAITIVGIAGGVGIVIYALHAGGKAK